MSITLFTIISQPKEKIEFISEEMTPSEKTNLLHETEDDTALIKNLPTETAEPQTLTSTEDSVILPSVHDIAVGDKLGSFIVESIDIGNYIDGQSFTITLTGEATISGETWVGMGGICFHKILEADITKIPTLKESPGANFCLTEDTIELRNELGIFGPPYDGGAHNTVVINDFTLPIMFTGGKGGAGKTAQLVKIIQR